MIKNKLTLFITALSALYLLSGLRGPKASQEVHRFSRLPVLHGGRLKPVDTVARNALLTLRGKQTLRRGAVALAPTRWLLDMLARPEVADKDAVFRIDNPDVIALIQKPRAKTKYFSFEDLRPFFPTISSQGNRAQKVEAVLRSPYQRAVLHLGQGLTLYQKLKNALQPSDTKNLPQELKDYESVIPPGLQAVHARSMGAPLDKPSFEALAAFFQKYSFLEANAPFHPMPPWPGGSNLEWSSMGSELRQRMKASSMHPSVHFFAGMMHAWQNQSTDAFSQALGEQERFLKEHAPKRVHWAKIEESFNRLQPLYRAMVLYILALLLACASWIYQPKKLRHCAFFILSLAFAVHTAGLLIRMLLEGRPPVTNLYSSAVFVGWGAVALGLFLERTRPQGIGAAAASAIGFSSLIIAHHLTGNGDTMEMMRAVLDSNFWLATHVVTITIGYSATYLAGFLAIIYILRSAFTKSMDAASAKTLSSMTYGIICFATFFSFVGTVLGGIWADQSWGRFWGWDPKENGALLIVLWNAIILHARWGGLIRERGIAICAVFGNIITSVSWFGVNMLGIGLHSYGFMDKALYALSAFTLSQLMIMGLGWARPLKHKPVG